MLRAIIVNIGTVAGVSAALLYEPQADVLEFTGGALSGGDTIVEQGQEPDTPTPTSPATSNTENTDSNQTGNSNSGKGGSKKDKGKNNGGGSPSPSSGSGSPSPSSSSSSPEPTKSATPTPSPSPSKTATPTPSPTKTKTPTPTPTPTPPPANDKDGTYNGSRVAVYYVDGGTKRQSGNLKIQVVIKNGKVADILWTEYPTGDHQKYTNKAYTSSAKPLIGLTIAELKAKKVATKTGATGTSTAFVTSLESVLQQL